MHQPTYRALRYGAMIEGLEDVLVDYYVEAVDRNGNIPAGEYLLFVLPEEVSADFNNDGLVSDADLVVWQTALGQTAAGDADGDGDTDGKDFLLRQAQVVAVQTIFWSELSCPRTWFDNADSRRSASSSAIDTVIPLLPA